MFYKRKGIHISYLLFDNRFSRLLLTATFLFSTCNEVCCYTDMCNNVSVVQVRKQMLFHESWAELKTTSPSINTACNVNWESAILFSVVFFEYVLI